MCVFIRDTGFPQCFQCRVGGTRSCRTLHRGSIVLVGGQFFHMNATFIHTDTESILLFDRDVITISQTWWLVTVQEAASSRTRGA